MKPDDQNDNKAPEKNAGVQAKTEQPAAKGKGKLKPAAEKVVDGLLIRTIPGCKRFCRAGYSFTEEPYGIALELLSEDQVNALRAEKMLIVEDAEFPLDGEFQAAE